MSKSSAHLRNLESLVQRLVDTAQAGEVEGLSPGAAAAYLGVSVSLFHDLNSRGMLPAPIELSERCPRWSKTELRAWLLAGSPPRARWIHMREIKLRAAG